MLVHPVSLHTDVVILRRSRRICGCLSKYEKTASMIDDNEVAIDNRMRRAERVNQSPINRLLEGAESASLAVGLATGSRTVGAIAKTFGNAKKFTSGLGVATLSENLDHLGEAAETAIARVEARLELQGCQIEEIERRLNSPELLEGIKAATLQAQRTKDKRRLERMALILANGFAENDLETESLDDMMRAAAELTESDIVFLRKIYDAQKVSLKDSNLNDSARMQRMISQWPNQIPAPVGRETILSQHRGSVARLQAHAFIQFRTPGSDVGGELVFLLSDGAKFYERLREIEVTLESSAVA